MDDLGGAQCLVMRCRCGSCWRNSKWEGMDGGRGENGKNAEWSGGWWETTGGIGNGSNDCILLFRVGSFLFGDFGDFGNFCLSTKSSGLRFLLRGSLGRLDDGMVLGKSIWGRTRDRGRGGIDVDVGMSTFIEVGRLVGKVMVFLFRRALGFIFSVGANKSSSLALAALLVTFRLRLDFFLMGDGSRFIIAAELKFIAGIGCGASLIVLSCSRACVCAWGSCTCSES